MHTVPWLSSAESLAVWRPSLASLVLVMGQTQSNDDNLDSVLSASDLDVDVEANVLSTGGVQALDDSGSDAVDDEEEEGTFANGTGHVSV
ncbi:hypothetical protein GQ600_23248 [Phytophthora cactorum]|nr:hypothetical protein GQ600_23248 [Phytophthora cactorum]